MSNSTKEEEKIVAQIHKSSTLLLQYVTWTACLVPNRMSNTIESFV